MVGVTHGSEVIYEEGGVEGKRGLGTISIVRPLSNTERRALVVLAENPDGCSRAIMLARGFPLAVLNRLFRAGLMTVERDKRGDNINKIVLKITEPGRRARQ
jgi:hypothetical protein